MEQEALIPEVLAGRAGPNGGNGRPRGASNLNRRVLERAVRGKLLPILVKVCEQALAGDPAAQKLILDRVWPRPRMSAVELGLPESKSPAEIRQAMHRLLAKIARGEILPDEGMALMATMRDVLDSHRIQTFDPVSSVEIQQSSARNQLADRLERVIEERRRRAITAGEESLDPS